MWKSRKFTKSSTNYARIETYYDYDKISFNSNHTAKQSFIRARKHIFCTYSVTVKKNMGKILYRMKILEKNAFTTFYCHKKIFEMLIFS